VDRFGPHWRAELAILGVIVFAAGLLAPLRDPDLGMHLATGQWIVEHGRVPMVEPFAWTREGAPFYAYSWLLEVASYFAYTGAGTVGLRLLNAMLVLATGVGMFVLGHELRWRPWIVIAMATLNVAIASFVAASLRPQVILFSALPLAWALTHRILHADRIRWATVGLFAVCAIVANVHLFFVLTAVPAFVMVLDRLPDRRRLLALGGATVAGWLASPYALVWPSVFALYFAPNPMLNYPSPIYELWPGFLLASRVPGLAIMAVGLALLPWALASAPLSARARLGYGVVWLGGLALFAMATRALAIWWLTLLPLAALALDRVSGPISPRAILVNKMAMYAAFLLLLANRAVTGGPDLLRGASDSRPLQSGVSRALNPLIGWLECHTKPQTGGRIFTVFNYGSYLTWRLPSYSSSIDGRTIFPDSVAVAESYYLAGVRGSLHGPWASADLAFLPQQHATTAVLDTARGWQRAAVSVAEGRPDSTGVALWIRAGWWRTAGIGAVPQKPIVIERQTSAAGAVTNRCVQEPHRADGDL
jgi:hypothetical protein